MTGDRALLEKVVFPTDFSTYAQAVFECVKDLRGVGEVILVNVIDSRKYPSSSVEILTIRARAELAKLEKTLEETKVPVRSLIKVGIPSQEIVKTADEVDASVILMGARGLSLFREVLLGSTTSDVMRQSKRPILITRLKLIEKSGKVEWERVCQDLLGKILFATDFSEPSQRALGLLKKLRANGAEEMVLVHVVDRGETEEEAGKLREAAEKELKTVEDGLHADGWHVKSIVTVGVASKEITSLADAENASLIALGARGKGLIDRLLVGSTAEAVARRADRPVLILR